MSLLLQEVLQDFRTLPSPSLPLQLSLKLAHTPPNICRSTFLFASLLPSLAISFCPWMQTFTFLHLSLLADFLFFNYFGSLYSEKKTHNNNKKKSMLFLCYDSFLSAIILFTLPSRVNTLLNYSCRQSLTHRNVT